MPSLLVDRRGRVLVLTINRPGSRNALDPDTLNALSAALESGAADADLGAAVLTGSDDVCFCAGMDLKAVAALGSALGPAVAGFQRALTASTRLPLVAAVRGMAAGGGAEIALRCDLVVASDVSTFRLPEISRGLLPGGGALQFPARIPAAIAAELVLLGSPVTAQRLYDIGAVNRIVPDTEVVSTAVRLAEQLAAQPATLLHRARALLDLTTAESAAASLRTYADLARPNSADAADDTTGTSRPDTATSMSEKRAL